MKRFLLFCVVVGLFAGQASAAMYEVTAPVARTFTQLSPITADNVLKLVIDSPGTPGSTTYSGLNGYGGDYGEGMLHEVGFAGHIMTGHVMLIGAAKTITSASGIDQIGMDLSNDNDDSYDYRAFARYSDASFSVSPVLLSLLPDTAAFISVDLDDLSLKSVVAIGFTIEINNRPSDDFHTSVVPVPGAVLLGILGLSAAGLKLRKFA